jgi:hypothetical protein
MGVAGEDPPLLAGGSGSLCKDPGGHSGTCSGVVDGEGHLASLCPHAR